MREYFFVIMSVAISMANSEVWAQRPEHSGTRPANKFLSVKDPAEYSPSFLSAFENGPSKVMIKDSLFIMDGDTDYFPTWLVRKKEYHLMAHSKGKDYELDLTRTNYTDLRYRFSVKSNGRLAYELKGTAILDFNFWIAGQTMDDGKEVLALGYAFYDQQRGALYELTVGEDDAGRVLAYIAQTSSKNKYALLCDVLLTTN